MPTVTVILTAHMKPTLADALTSIEGQTRDDYHVVLMDSGAWRNDHDEVALELFATQGDWLDWPKLTWEFTGESPDIRQHKCPVSWATNEAIRRGLVSGKYVATFYDDDIYYPTFIERMAGYLDEHPDELAVWCTQDRIALLRDGNTERRGQIRADHVLHPGELDNRVDGGQVMFRREALDRIGDPWLPEEPRSCHHSDGIFLEKLATVAGSIQPIDDALLAHRFTPWSTFSPT